MGFYIRNIIFLFSRLTENFEKDHYKACFTAMLTWELKLSEPKRSKTGTKPGAYSGFCEMYRTIPQVKPGVNEKLKHIKCLNCEDEMKAIELDFYELL